MCLVLHFTGCVKIVTGQLKLPTQEVDGQIPAQIAITADNDGFHGETPLQRSLFFF